MIREFIPGTRARQDRLLKHILAKRADDILIELEFRDGTVKYKPGTWNDEYEWYETADGRPVIVRGDGAVQRVAGTKMIRAYAPSYGRVSTEAAVLGTAMDNGDVTLRDQYDEVIDVDARQADLQRDEPLANVEPEELPDDVAADGGHREVANVETDLPTAGYSFQLDKALKYDPFPVSSNEAATAVDIAEKAGEDDTSRLRTALIGFIVGAVSLLAFYVAFELVQSWTTGSGSGGGGGRAVGTLLLLAIPASYRETIRRGVRHGRRLTQTAAIAVAALPMLLFVQAAVTLAHAIDTVESLITRVRTVIAGVSRGDA